MTNLDGLDETLLEPLLRDFVRLIGLAATMDVVRTYGGTRLHIAKRAQDNGALASLIGLDKAAVLSRQYGGDRPTIPMATVALTELRNRRMRAQRASLSVRELALANRMSERHAYRIVGGADQADDETTGSLFD